MDVAAIISTSRRQTGYPTTAQISDAVMLGYLNIIYKEVYSRLTMVDSRLTWQQYLTNVVAGQAEYTLPIVSATET
jgi:hypothetical protein